MMDTDSISRSVGEGFTEEAQRMRSSGGKVLDLTDRDTERCGLGWPEAELQAVLTAAGDAAGSRSPAAAYAQACDAVASYLAGRASAITPERVRVVGGRAAAWAAALGAVCGRGEEILCPTPADRALATAAEAAGVNIRRYALAYDREWHLDRRSVQRAVTPGTRAVAVGNPSEPTGAMLSPGDLAYLETICGERGAALVGDEALIETALGPAVTVLGATRCLALHVSDLGGVCGLPRIGVGWVAAAGPDDLVASALARIDARIDLGQASAPAALLLAMPALLARRERFLEALRARLAGSRAALATGSLREAPWSLCWGRGGASAVLQIGSGESEAELCRALLADGVALQTGSEYGLGGDGHLVVSLMPPPETFAQALPRLDARLRAPLRR